MSVYTPGRPIKYHPHSGIGTRPPELPGEYRICNSQGNILYIGETNNLLRRMQQHIRSGKLSAGNTFEYKVANTDSTSQTRRLHEQQKIARHIHL